MKVTKQAMEIITPYVIAKDNGEFNHSWGFYLGWNCGCYTMNESCTHTPQPCDSRNLASRGNLRY